MLAADLAHRLRWPDEVRLPNLVAFFFLPDRGRDEVANLVVGCAAPQEGLDIVLLIENRQVRKWPSAVNRMRLQTCKTRH